MPPLPPTRLNSALLVRKEEIPETTKPPAPPATGHRVNVSYRPRSTTYEQLRQLAFTERRPIQAIIDEAVETWLASHTD